VPRGIHRRQPVEVEAVGRHVPLRVAAVPAVGVEAGLAGPFERGDPAAGDGVPIFAPLSFSLTADFNLTNGTLLSSDANLTVAGSIPSVPSDLTAFLHTGFNTFYQSGSVARYGDMVVNGNLQRIDFTFAGNAGQIFPGFPVYVILNVGSAGSITYGGGLSPSSSALLDGYTSGISGTATAGSPQLLWSTTVGSVDVFTPLPRSISMGLALLAGLGATRFRRVLQLR